MSLEQHYKFKAEDAKAQGLKQGRAEGEAAGQEKFSKLILKLMELNRSEEIPKAASDENYRERLMKEFDL